MPEVITLTLRAGCPARTRPDSRGLGLHARDNQSLCRRDFTANGISVPGDVSIVGFVDIPEAEHFLPALTTVRQDFAGLGRSTFMTGEG